MLLKNILGLRDITATDVMVPRADIVSVDIEDGIEKILHAMVAANHSRVPVTRGSLDDVLGFLHIKDVSRCFHAGNAKDLMKPSASRFISRPLCGPWICCRKCD